MCSKQGSICGIIDKINYSDSRHVTPLINRLKVKEKQPYYTSITRDSDNK